MRKMILSAVNIVLLTILILRYGITIGTSAVIVLSLVIWGGTFLFRLQKNNQNRIYKTLWNLFFVGIIIFTFTFLILIVLINSEVNSIIENYEEVDYAIILGAGLNGEQVSNILKLRLDAAIMQLSASDITIIVSGGQGDDEFISEAEAMSRYLIQNGIDESRIILEDKSTSTQENIQYCNQKMIGESLNVAIFTSDYHMYRAKMLGRRVGWLVQGYSGKNPISIRVNYMVREFFALIKDIVIGN